MWFMLLCCMSPSKAFLSHSSTLITTLPFPEPVPAPLPPPAARRTFVVVVSVRGDIMLLCNISFVIISWRSDSITPRPRPVNIQILPPTPTDRQRWTLSTWIDHRSPNSVREKHPKHYRFHGLIRKSRILSCPSDFLHLLVLNIPPVQQSLGYLTFVNK